MEFLLQRLDLGLFYLFFFCSPFLRFVAKSPVFCAKQELLAFCFPSWQRRCCGRCTCSQPFLGWLSLSATMSQFYKINLMEGMLCFNVGLVNYYYFNTPWFSWPGTEPREQWNTEVLIQTWSSPPGTGIYLVFWNLTDPFSIFFIFFLLCVPAQKAKSLLSLVLFLVGLWYFFFPFLPGLALIFPCLMGSL